MFFTHGVWIAWFHGKLLKRIPFYCELRYILCSNIYPQETTTDWRWLFWKWNLQSWIPVWHKTTSSFLWSKVQLPFGGGGGLPRVPCALPHSCQV